MDQPIDKKSTCYPECIGTFEFDREARTFIFRMNVVPIACLTNEMYIENIVDCAKEKITWFVKEMIKHNI